AGIVSLVVGKPEPKVLQDFLASKLALSRRTAKAAIDGRSVWVNRKCVWIARYALKTGDLVEMPAVVAKAAQRQSGGKASGVGAAGRRHVRVLWQDDAYLVCDKPAGVVSCDDPRSVESILREQEKLPNLEAVHRLDRDTTGCLLFAKNHAALEAAIELFKTRRVSKIYHAVALGAFRFAHRIVDAPIDGQPALSRITREASSPDASFLRVRIETGRTNQIRRHLASIRNPIVGDRVFGVKNAHDPRLMKVPRQMLHASSLILPNPLSPRDEINVHSPLPADFRAVLRLFGMGK
ncbi:MAG: RluA family pseudouridine synthase, partial [Kiritimatiellae bacterium]|nr:RluA family pseudouridine synthase [Kiritimatiellia bacterium]